MDAKARAKRWQKRLREHEERIQRESRPNPVVCAANASDHVAKAPPAVGLIDESISEGAEPPAATSCHCSDHPPSIRMEVCFNDEGLEEVDELVATSEQLPDLPEVEFSPYAHSAVFAIF